LGLSLRAEKREQLGAYLGLLTKWNRAINLTSLPLEPLSDGALDRLIFEPLIAASRLEKPASGRLLDIGSGGGSPAVPLAIALPGVHVSMVESKVRKAAFLREVIRTIALSDPAVHNSRLEELLADPELHEAADYVSIRAVRLDRAMWQTLAAFTRPGGLVLWFRSESTLNERAFFPLFAFQRTEPLIPANQSTLVLLRRNQD
jgi:16S rRNA (guanine527-N7)-methyltransferase